MLSCSNKSVTREKQNVIQPLLISTLSLSMAYTYMKAFIVCQNFLSSFSFNFLFMCDRACVCWRAAKVYLLLFSSNIVLWVCDSICVCQTRQTSYSRIVRCALTLTWTASKHALALNSWTWMLALALNRWEWWWHRHAQAPLPPEHEQLTRSCPFLAILFLIPLTAKLWLCLDP